MLSWQCHLSVYLTVSTCCPWYDCDDIQMAVTAADMSDVCTDRFLDQISGQDLTSWESWQVAHWDSIAVCCIDPPRWGNGD